MDIFIIKLKVSSKNRNMIIDKFGERTICIEGIGKLLYQDGFPLSLSIQKLKENDIEVSILHIIEEFWNNGWSWKTIENKLKGEMIDDIDKSLSLDFIYLKSFYDCLEQPKRANGGYEESRKMIFNYLFLTPEEGVKHLRKMYELHNNNR